MRYKFKLPVKANLKERDTLLHCTKTTLGAFADIAIKGEQLIPQSGILITGLNNPAAKRKPMIKNIHLILLKTHGFYVGGIPVLKAC
jgi:hypothetical protein